MSRDYVYVVIRDLKVSKRALINVSLLRHSGFGLALSEHKVAELHLHRNYDGCTMHMTVSGLYEATVETLLYGFRMVCTVGDWPS